MKLLTLSFLILGLSTQAFAATNKCTYGNLQRALHDGADSLAIAKKGKSYKNTVQYEDFTNGEQFNFALKEMAAIGVSSDAVENSWITYIKKICPKSNLAQNDVGPDQTLDGLAKLLNTKP